MDKTTGFALLGFLFIVLGASWAPGGGGGGGGAAGFAFAGGGGGGGSGGMTADQICSQAMAAAEARGRNVDGDDYARCVQETQELLDACPEAISCMSSASDPDSAEACLMPCLMKFGARHR